MRPSLDTSSVLAAGWCDGLPRGENVVVEPFVREGGASVEAVRAWRSPARETTDHPLLAGEPARLHEQEAAQALEKALRGMPADVEVHRRVVEGHARTVLADASRDADLLIVGARRRPRHFGLQLGRVAHGVLHHSVCPVAVVPERDG